MFAAALMKVFDYIATHRWAQIVCLCIAVFCTLGLYLAWRDNGVRKRTLEQVEARQAEVRVAVNERVTEIATEERTAADEALEARSTDVHYPSADLVPESLQGIGFRDTGRSGTS